MCVISPHSDGSQEAFDPYYSENYSESSSLSCHESRRSLASTHSDPEPSNASLQEYMIIVRCLHKHNCVIHHFPSLANPLKLIFDHKNYIFIFFPLEDHALKLLECNLTPLPPLV